MYYFESHQVFTPLQLESAMVRFETGRLDGRTVNEIKFQNDTLPSVDGKIQCATVMRLGEKGFLYGQWHHAGFDRGRFRE